MKIQGFVLCLLLFGVGEMDFASAQVPSNEKEYRRRVKRLNLRFEGFFDHKRDQKRWENQRKSGIPELKNEREAYARSREKARKGFVRQPPKDMEPLRLQWERVQMREEELKARQRVDYSRQQDKIKEIERTARQIPPMEELGID